MQSLNPKMNLEKDNINLKKYFILLLISPYNNHFSNHTPRRNETHEVIKYLEYCVHRLHNEDPGIHNLLLSLYAKQVSSFI